MIFNEEIILVRILGCGELWDILRSIIEAYDINILAKILDVPPNFADRT